MKRKHLFALLIAAVLLIGCILAAAAHKTGAQEYTVGICQFTQHEALDAAARGFKAALTDKFGDQVAFDEQNANGDFSACTVIIDELLSKEADLILADSTSALQLASAVDTDTPILGTAVTDYETALQLKDFDGTVGGNISGTSDLVPPEQQAAMIRELFPDAERIGMLYCSAEMNSQYQLNTLETELTAMGYSCEAYPFVDSSDISAATESAAAACDVIYVPTDNTAAANAGIIANICLPAKIPVVTGDENTGKICGAATLSVDYYALGYATGEMAAQILTGEKAVSDMPIQYASGFTKKYNPEICTELGITIPEDYTELNAK